MQYNIHFAILFSCATLFKLTKILFRYCFSHLIPSNNYINISRSRAKRFASLQIMQHELVFRIVSICCKRLFLAQIHLHKRMDVACIQHRILEKANECLLLYKLYCLLSILYASSLVASQPVSRFDL